MLLFVIIHTLIFSYIPNYRAQISNDKIVEYAIKFTENRKLIRSGIGMDCSGYTSAVYAHFEIYLPPSSKDQIKMVECTDIELMSSGDLVFFTINGKTISHVGIYLCDDKFIHSPGRNDKIRIDSLTHSYWKDKFVCGGAIK